MEPNAPTAEQPQMTSLETPLKPLIQLTPERPETTAIKKDINAVLKDKRSIRETEALRGILNRLAEGSGEASTDTGKDHLDTVATKKEIKTLRSPDKPYGESLTKRHHHKDETMEESEEAQRRAYRDLQEKIDSGAVEVRSIGADIVRELGVQAELGTIPETADGIITAVGQELDMFREQGFVDEGEREMVLGEMEKFLKDYQEAYPDMDIATAYELVRDNARKLVYQNKMDRRIIAGSDHGLLHIVGGNIRFAEQMMEGLDVDPKTRVLIRQSTYDHDIGYTVGAIHRRSVEAIEDHPLFSARLIEDNEGYYIAKFGQEGYEAIRELVLMHSYARKDFDVKPREGEDFNFDLARSIVSTADCLGVTAETKMPAIFRDHPGAFRILLRMRLEAELSRTLDDGTLSYSPELITRYRQELIGLIEQEEHDEDRRGDYVKAVDEFFNDYNAQSVLGKMTGVVERVGIERSDNGHPSLKVVMRRSEICAMLGNLFGEKDGLKSFKKLMEDNGVDFDNESQEGINLRNTDQHVTIRGSQGITFEFLPHLYERAPDAIIGTASTPSGESGRLTPESFSEALGYFEEVHALSIRADINSTLERLPTLTDKDERAAEIITLKHQFMENIESKTSPQEAKQLMRLLDIIATGESVRCTEAELADILEHMPSDELKREIRERIVPEGHEGDVEITSDHARMLLRRYVTARERVYLETS